MAAPLLAGILLGLSVAVPFGPVSLVCVQQSLTRGSRQGVVAGFGAATAHGIFATAAIVGADVAAAVITPWTGVFHCLSAVILVGLGIRTIAKARRAATPSRGASLHTAYAFSLMLALSNPLTVLPYLALATIAVDAESSATLSLWSVPGIILATAAWYTGLSFLASMLRHGMSARMAWLLNLAAGCVLIGFGAIVGRDLL